MNKGTAKKSSSSRDATGLQQPGKNGDTQQQAAEILHESGRKFPPLFDKAGFAAALSEAPHGVFVDINEAWVNLFGYSRQEVIGKTSFELNINPDSAERARILAQLQVGGSARNIEITLRTKSGEWRNFLTNIDLVEIDGQEYFLNTIEDITERKRAEEALRESEERYRAVIESALDAIIVTDPAKDGKVLSANPATCRMFGYSLQELEGLSREAIIDTSDASLVTLLKQRAQHGQASAELIYKRKDGTRFSGELSSVLYRDKNGEARAVAIIRDVTERKRTEEQLERSNQKLNEILTSIQDDFYVLDHDWVFVYANRQFTSKIGKEPEDFIGNNIWKMFPKHIGTTFEENLRAAMEKRETRRFEIPGKYTSAWYRMTAFPSKEGITVLGTDITDRRQAEEALRESRSKYQDLIETTSDFIWETDSQGKYTYCSPQMEKLWGIQSEDMIGKTPFDVMPPKDKEGALEYFQEVIRSAAPFSGVTTTTLNSQGDLFYVETSGVPFFDHNGKLLGFRGITRDVTERNRTRRQVFEANQRLVALMNALPVGVSFSDDPTCQHVTGNPAALAQFEVGSEDNLSASAPDSNAPGRQVKFFRDGKPITDADLPLQRAVAENREIPPMEFEVHLPSGRRWWASGSGAPICDQDGNVIGGVAVTQDITVRKRGEEQLRELSQRLTYHVDNSPLAVIEWGPDMRLIRWSGTAEQIFGWKAEEVLGKHMEDFHWIYEEDKSQVSDVSTDLRTGTNSQRFSANRNYRKDGSVVYCEWYNSSLMDESGKLRSILSLVLDVTDRKRAEEALLENQEQLESLNETLEEKVHEKTEEVRHLASDVIQAVQHERHRISHILHDDLQQRIYAIQMQLTLLHDELQREKESARKEVADIEQQLAEILTVTRRLSIDLSPPILRDEGLAHAIDWLAAHMRQRYGLSIELQADEPFAIPDEALHVLLFNCVRELLFNVVKHAQASGAIVALKWIDTDLLIEVRDDGKGFQIQALEQRPDREANEGDHLQSGFGLTTIRHQLSLFGGYMEIHSEPGAGTRVIMIVSVPEAEQEP